MEVCRVRVCPSLFYRSPEGERRKGRVNRGSRGRGAALTNGCGKVSSLRRWAVPNPERRRAMHRLQQVPFVALAGAMLLVVAACAPGRMAVTSNPYDIRPFGSACAGKEVLRVQNNLRESVEIVRLARGEQQNTAQPVSVALLSPGAHTLELEPEPDRYLAARTAGSASYLSTTEAGSALQNPGVRLDVRCRATV
jgi:hypothetical protein